MAKQGYCKCGCGNKTSIAKRNRRELGHIKNQPVLYFATHNGVRGKKGKDHYNWKGNDAGYKAFHLRVNLVRGKPKVCENCGSKYFVEWANLTGHYEDIFDYKALCRKCHNKFDDIANKGWITRRKTSQEARAGLTIPNGGDARQ